MVRGRAALLLWPESLLSQVHLLGFSTTELILFNEYLEFRCFGPHQDFNGFVIYLHQYGFMIYVSFVVDCTAIVCFSLLGGYYNKVLQIG